VGWWVREGLGKEGEMTQILYAHMNKIKVIKGIQHNTTLLAKLYIFSTKKHDRQGVIM
jgi:hypothetical protein